MSLAEKIYLANPPNCVLTRVLVRTSNGITKDEFIQRVKQFGDLAYHANHMGRTSVATLVIKESLSKKTIQSLSDSLKPAIVSRITVSELPVSTDLNVTDLRIIKCLLPIRCQNGDI